MARTGITRVSRRLACCLPLPGLVSAAGTGRGAGFLIALPHSPSVPLPCGFPAQPAPGSHRGLAAARGKRALWLPTAAQLEEKARISWLGPSPSRLLPAAECFGAEGRLFLMGFGLGATGCPCAELLPSAQASRRQARSQGTSVDTILQCQNLPPPQLCPTHLQNPRSGRASGQHGGDVPLRTLHAHASSPAMCHGDGGGAGWPRAIAWGL